MCRPHRRRTGLLYGASAAGLIGLAVSAAAFSSFFLQPAAGIGFGNVRQPASLASHSAEMPEAPPLKAEEDEARSAEEAGEGKAEKTGLPIEVPVFLSKSGKVENVPLEEYVRGVVAAEMPVLFEPEALKAQAIAARTYAVRRLMQNAAPNGGADIPALTDAPAHQAYATDEELMAKWGMYDYARNMDKLSRAVKETEGQVLMYEGSPIEAVFFSTSNGYTENSEEVWQTELPYLRSVASPWDEKYAPDFERETRMRIRDFYKKMGLTPSSGPPKIAVLERSEGGRVAAAEIDGKRFTGREIRERLGLPSTDFDWRFEEDSVIFTTRGYGHGVGLSQWGANGMAKEGYTAEEILLYYYRGVTLETF